MAPIEPDLRNSNLWPTAVLSSYAALNITLIYVVLHRVLYRAYLALPPGLATRERSSRRDNQLLAFSGLAFLSSSVALYYGWHVLATSYSIWAYDRGEAVPTGLWRDGGLFASGDQAISLKLGRWLYDTDLVAEVFKAALDCSRHQWWAQQVLLSAAVWSTYAAVEGRRRNMPHVWAFAVLSMTVSVSFAQNLFFLAVLLSPVPLSEQQKHGDLVPAPQSPAGRHARKPSKAALATAAAAAAAKTESTMTFIPHRVQAAFESRFPAKPSGWVPHSSVFAITLLGSVFNTILIAFASNTPSFHTFLSLYMLNVLSPHLVLRLAPVSWGTTSKAPSHSVHAAIKSTGVLSTAIYAAQSVIALLDNSPQNSSRYYTLPHQQTKREQLAHPGHAIFRILASFGDNPAIGRVAVDALLCGLSLVVWAGLRGLDVSRMLRASGWVTKSEVQAVGSMTAAIKAEVKHLVGEDEDEEEEEEEDAPSPPKGRGANVWLGEEVHEEDWEAGALAWGMLVLGGLGVGSAAVFGAEII